MIRPEEVYKIGQIGKPHGVKGEMSFTFTDDVFDRVECDYIVCRIDGIFVPFYVEDYRFRSDTTALLKLEGIDTTDQTRAFTNVDVYFPKKYACRAEEEDERELTWNVFVGYTVTDTVHGLLGDIVEVDNSTVNTLFVVDREGEELLIPAQESFIVKMDNKKRKMLVTLPDGLLHLDLSDDGDH
ncbi:MAG: ribosome maturation factor RimM [Bacteroides sp.]